jgi:hypothetical protein
VPPEVNQLETLVKIVAPLGIGGLLAAFMFLWYRRDIREHTAAIQREAHERVESMRKARERDQALTTAVTAALDRSTEAHMQAIQESAQNRQLFLDLRNELIMWRQHSGNRRHDDHHSA